MYIDNSPRALVEREEREAAARRVAEIERRKAAEAERIRKAEEARRLDAQARAVPDALFADDPEIMALRADYEVKQRQRPVVSLVDHSRLHQVMEGLKERVKAGMADAMITAAEDVTTGDPTLRRAMVLQRLVDEDQRKLELLTKVQERLNRSGFGMMVREREQLAGLALEAALMERKRQYLREHPEPLNPPAADPTIAAPASRPILAPFAPEEDDGLDSPHPTYAMPVTLRPATEVQTVRTIESPPAADDVVAV